MSEEKILHIPAGVQAVEIQQYAADQELVEVYVPEGVEVIRAKGFCNCRQLKKLHLPGTLKHIDMKAFENCPLEDIYYNGTEEMWVRMEISPIWAHGIAAARKHFLVEADEKAEATGAAKGTLQNDPREFGPNHELEIFDKVRRLLADGGDGRLHIVVPWLGMDGVLTKPGDLSLMIFPQGTTMLIDTVFSANWPMVKRFLEEIGLTRLDYMAFSHGCKDHVINAQPIADLLYAKGGQIDHFLWTGQKHGNIVPAFVEFLKTKDTDIDLAVRDGRSFDIDGVHLDILGPTEEEILADASDVVVRNSQSMIMKFTYGQATYLTAGDLYIPQEKIVVERCGEKLQADIINTNHHGNFTSNCKEWLDATAGKIYFSCSNDNGNTALCQELEARGVAQYSTGCQGTLLISASEQGEYEVKTQYDRGMLCLQRVN